MNPQQALQLMVSLSNSCVSKGGIFESIGEAATINMALNVIDSVIKENETLRNEIAGLEKSPGDSEQKF